MSLNRRSFLASAAAAAALLAFKANAGPKKPPKPALTKGPFVSVLEPRAARIRWESTDPEPRVVTLTAPDGTTQTAPTTSREDAVAYQWPLSKPRAEDAPFIDAKGTFYIQDATFAGLTPGALYTWKLTHSSGQSDEGQFLAPVAPKTAFRLGWIADTRQLRNRASAPLLLAQKPQIIIHGGDIQYQSDPRDTWNGFFVGMQDLLRTAPAHFTVGNHEAEGMDEFKSQFLRLFDGQGDRTSASGPGYHAFSYGSVRFIVINSEEDLTGKGGSQESWLRSELKTAAADKDIWPVIVLHRPLFSFSRRYPNPGVREFLHPLFQDHGVKLVLTGHNHCYERFEADGITYITDGGGGASLYDSDERLSHYKRKAPSEIPLRKVAESSHGISTLDVRADATATWTRLRIDGTTTDTLSLPLK